MNEFLIALYYSQTAIFCYIYLILTNFLTNNIIQLVYIYFLMYIFFYCTFLELEFRFWLSVSFVNIAVYWFVSRIFPYAFLFFFCFPFIGCNFCRSDQSQQCQTFRLPHGSNLLFSMYLSGPLKPSGSRRVKYGVKVRIYVLRRKIRSRIVYSLFLTEKREAN